MSDRFLRVRISEELYKRYRVLCAEMGLSIPKQTAELIRKFIEITQENNKKIQGK